MSEVWNMNLSQIKARLRNGPYAWPGGYPLYFLAADGEPLSFAAVRENWRQIVWAKLNPGLARDWEIIGCEINWEDSELRCAHSGAPIESAYGEEPEAIQ